ncbi:MFS transporter [Streptomyces sp. CA-135486]|uniref:MFS transporter n=1 Tax=Streptomyces sp. CA-135486 TaxID=3240049 RepID=UPI003D8A7482
MQGRPGRPRLSELMRVSGGARYAVALAVDSLGSGMLRPFLLLYGIKVLRLGVTETGTAMSVGMLLGLAAVPFFGRWIDRGARTAAVACAMLVRVLGIALLLAADGIGGSAVWGFTAAALFLGIGNQCWPPAHAALVTTLADGRNRDAALAAGRSLRNAGMGAGALIATVSMTGGTGALRTLAAVTALGYTVAAALAWSMRVTAARHAQGPSADVSRAGRPRRGRVTALDIANLPYAFCFNVLEVALPAVLVSQLHASPAWSAGIFVGNTVIVVTTQIAVVVWMSRFARRSALAASGLVLSASYLGFWAAGGIAGQGAAAAVAAVSVLYTAGEIMYTGSATALIAATTPSHLLGRALSRFQVSSGIGLAASPAVLMTLFAWGPGALWGSLAATTLLAAVVIHRWAPGDQAESETERAAQGSARHA